MNTNAKDWEILVQDEEGAILICSYRCPHCGKYQDWLAFVKVDYRLIEPFHIMGKCERCKKDVPVRFREKEKSQVTWLSSIQHAPKF